MSPGYCIILLIYLLNYLSGAAFRVNERLVSTFLFNSN